MLVAAVAVAALCAAIVGFVAVALGDDPSGGQRVAFTDAPAGVEASAQLRATDWGTEIELVVDGLADDDAPDDVYWLWLSTADGDRVAAGTFRGDGTIHMAAALPLDEAARVWVTDAADDVVLDAVLS